MKNKIITKAIEEEDKVIGNLKSQFLRNNLHRQRQIGISPAIANGNISLGYYRGLQVGRENTTKEIISLLKKNFPRAATFLKKHYSK